MQRRRKTGKAEAGYKGGNRNTERQTSNWLKEKEMEDKINRKIYRKGKHTPTLPYLPN